ncbi:MAG: LemA family protein [Nanoarchaeota archaeon]
MKENKFRVKSWMVIVAIVVVLILWFFGTYNGLISLSSKVDAQWANVESQYQRRIDLIPNLVSTVKGYAKHEENIFTEITELRSRWQDAKSSNNINAEIQTINQVEGALSRLLVLVEAYPDLKASQNFLSLQDELAGTENRIAVERMRYNEAVRGYNIKIKRIPAAIVANILNFESRPYFEAEEGAEQAPQVNF